MKKKPPLWVVQKKRGSVNIEESNSNYRRRRVIITIVEGQGEKKGKVGKVQNVC